MSKIFLMNVIKIIIKNQHTESKLKTRMSGAAGMLHSRYAFVRVRVRRELPATCKRLRDGMDGRAGGVFDYSKNYENHKGWSEGEGE